MIYRDKETIKSIFVSLYVFLSISRGTSSESVVKRKLWLKISEIESIEESIFGRCEKNDVVGCVITTVNRNKYRVLGNSKTVFNLIQDAVKEVMK